MISVARLQTSALVVSRELALQVPWDPSVERFQDFDWLLRVSATGARIVIVPEALSVWRHLERRPSVGDRYSRDWRQALEWIDQCCRGLLGDRATRGLVRRSRHSQINRMPARREPIDPQVRARLEAEYTPDVTALSALLGREMSALWFSRPRDQPSSCREAAPQLSRGCTGSDRVLRNSLLRAICAP